MLIVLSCQSPGWSDPACFRTTSSSFVDRKAKRNSVVRELDMRVRNLTSATHSLVILGKLFSLSTTFLQNRAMCVSACLGLFECMLFWTELIPALCMCVILHNRIWLLGDAAVTAVMTGRWKWPYCWLGSMCVFGLEHWILRWLKIYWVR